MAPAAAEGNTRDGVSFPPPPAPPASRMPRTLHLVDWDPAGPARFAAALGARARAVEHVGSTAVPGLARLRAPR